MQEVLESSSTSEQASDSVDNGSAAVQTHRSRAAVMADKDLKERLASLQRAFRTTSEQKVKPL